MATLESDALCTLAELKEVLNISGSSYDTRLTLAINMATRNILGYLDRTIASTAYTEEYDGTGTPMLMLKNYPIIGDPTTVNIDAARSFAASGDLTVDEDYLVNANEGMLRKIGTDEDSDSYDAWPKGRLNIKVAYTAGYATIPVELNLACRLYAAYMYKKMGTQGNKSYTIGQLSVVEDDHPSGIPNAFRCMVDRYRRTEADELFDEISVSEFA